MKKNTDPIKDLFKVLLKDNNITGFSIKNVNTNEEVSFSKNEMKDIVNGNNNE